MKIFANPIDRVIAKRLAQKPQPLRIKAQKYEEDKISTVDDATDHAKAYWMLGWTWEEIEAILEDMGFSESIASKAVNKAKEYAFECLKDGPFSIFKEGQLVLLKNGLTGVLTHIRSKQASLACEDGSMLIIPASSINVEASQKLTEAYRLRQTAKKIFKEADDPIALPGEYPQELEPKQEEKFELRVTPTLQTPKTWGPYLPETFVDIPEAGSTIQNWVNTIMALREEASKVEEDVKEASKLLQDYKAQHGKLETEQQEVAKMVGSVLGAESQALGELYTPVFKRFNDLLVGYRQVIESGKPKPPKLTDEYNEMQRLLQEKAPEIFEDIMNTLEEWKEANTVIRETLVTEVGISQPRPSTFKKRKSQSIWEKVKGWLGNAWSSVKSSVSNLFSKTIPEVEDLSNKLEALLSKTQSQVQAERVNAALKVYVK